jgi:hypothetical protein
MESPTVVERNKKKNEEQKMSKFGKQKGGDKYGHKAWCLGVWMILCPWPLFFLTL